MVCLIWNLERVVKELFTPQDVSSSNWKTNTGIIPSEWALPGCFFGENWIALSDV